MAETEQLRTKLTIALVFDFDDTLFPDSTAQLFYERANVNREQFRKEIDKRVYRDGQDHVFGFLNYVLDEVARDGSPLKGLKNSDLEDFGRTQLAEPFEGIHETFKYLRDLVKDSAITRSIHYGQLTDEHTYYPKVEFYVVSGGLEPLVKAGLARHGLGDFFEDRVVACQLDDGPNGLARIRRAVSFTEKTRYLYEINKGFFGDRDPTKVNEWVDPASRPVPFHNMIYVGDGLTDIPCFSMLEKFGGTPIAVVPPEAKVGEKYQRFVVERGMNFFERADYRMRVKGSLGALLVKLVEQRLLDMTVRIQFLAASP
ncbi:MAG: haloacid dehalogenase-like hydrolase [Deltaproteobacteria bacterium]|nr:haloacid dehalogenase-like hydrolase [Deltaproteobacteria bacterium]